MYKKKLNHYDYLKLICLYFYFCMRSIISKNYAAFFYCKAFGLKKGQQKYLKQKLIFFYFSALKIKILRHLYVLRMTKLRTKRIILNFISKNFFPLFSKVLNYFSDYFILFIQKIFLTSFEKIDEIFTPNTFSFSCFF